jgi:DNA-binding NarL/FixJ family response regulator
MDIDLGGGIDGTQAAEAILKERDIPIVFLSSHTDPEVVGKTEKITSYGYVVKSSSMTVLDASIKMAFKLFAARMEAKQRDESLRASEKSTASSLCT